MKNRIRRRAFARGFAVGYDATKKTFDVARSKGMFGWIADRLLRLMGRKTSAVCEVSTTTDFGPPRYRRFAYDEAARLGFAHGSKEGARQSDPSPGYNG